MCDQINIFHKKTNHNKNFGLSYTTFLSRSSFCFSRFDEFIILLSLNGSPISLAVGQLDSQKVFRELTGERQVGTFASKNDNL